MKVMQLNESVVVVRKDKSERTKTGKRILKEDKLFSAMEVLYQCVNKKEFRFFMRYVYCHWGMLFATDGHIMAVVSVDGIKKFKHGAFYWVMKVGNDIYFIEKGKKFDDVSGVNQVGYVRSEFPVKGAIEMFQKFDTSKAEWAYNDSTATVSYLAHEVMKHGICVNVNYLSKLKSIKHWKIMCEGNSDPVIFEGGEDGLIYVILMPIKI